MILAQKVKLDLNKSLCIDTKIQNLIQNFINEA